MNDKISFDVKRSKGFEGMASSPDGSKLYPLLEGVLWKAETNQYENDGGKEYLRILEFNPQIKNWTGNFWKYPLEDNNNAIGDFNMIDDTRALIIERDNNEGVAEKACAADAKDKTNCFPNLPKFKRVYLIKFDQSNQGQNVEKLGYIDLLNIQDPNKVAKNRSVKACSPFRSSPLKMWIWWMINTSSSVTTTTCRSPAAESRIGPTTTS